MLSVLNMESGAVGVHKKAKLFLNKHFAYGESSGLKRKCIELSSHCVMPSGVGPEPNRDVLARICLHQLGDLMRIVEAYRRWADMHPGLVDDDL
jgi:hypothetical protein